MWVQDGTPMDGRGAIADSPVPKCALCNAMIWEGGVLVNQTEDWAVRAKIGKELEE
jgi:hypothetical protein